MINIGNSSSENMSKDNRYTSILQKYIHSSMGRPTVYIFDSDDEVEFLSDQDIDFKLLTFLVNFGFSHTISKQRLYQYLDTWYMENTDFLSKYFRIWILISLGKVSITDLEILNFKKYLTCAFEGKLKMGARIEKKIYLYQTSSFPLKIH